MDDKRIDDALRRDAGLSDDAVPNAASPADQAQAKTEQALERRRDETQIEAIDDDPGEPEDRVSPESQARLAEMATRRGTRA